MLGKKRGMFTFAVRQISCFPPLIYSKDFYFHLQQLASFELKNRIFNFYQCTRGNLTFLDILSNITFTFTEKSVIEQPLY